jgi:hypothetical protein
MYTKEFIEKLPDEALKELIDEGWNFKAIELLSEEHKSLYEEAKKDVSKYEQEIEQNAFLIKDRVMSIIDNTNDEDEVECLDNNLVEFMDAVAYDLDMTYSHEYGDRHPDAFWVQSTC